MYKTLVLVAILTVSATLTAQQILNPKVSNITKTSVEISFNTDLPGMTNIHYMLYVGFGGYLDKVYRDETFATDHRVVLNDLLQCSSYKIIIESWLENNSLAQVGPIYFQTANNGCLETPITLEKVDVPAIAHAGDKGATLIGIKFSTAPDTKPLYSLDAILISVPFSISYFHNVKLWEMKDNKYYNEVKRENGIFYFYPHAILDSYTPTRTFILLVDIDQYAPSVKFPISTGPEYIAASSVVYGRPIPITGGASVLPFILLGVDVAVKTKAEISFSLEQNYPNPFNPTTMIKFALPQREKVSLKIFDALGREVKVLVNEVREAGEYQEILDAHDLSSGTYYYLLQVGTFRQTKKMTLLK